MDSRDARGGWGEDTCATLSISRMEVEEAGGDEGQLGLPLCPHPVDLTVQREVFSSMAQDSLSVLLQLGVRSKGSEL